MDGLAELCGMIFGCVILCLLVAFGLFAAVVAIKVALALF